MIQNLLCDSEVICYVCDSTAEIHADAPEFVEMSIEQEILETGLKVVDMLAPYAKGGKIGKLNRFIIIILFFILKKSWQTQLNNARNKTIII